MDDLVFRPMVKSDSDLMLFRDAFNRNHSPKSIERLHWQYFENPSARLDVDFALDESNGRVAAIYAVCPVRVRVSGRLVLACLSLNTLTDSEYRGRGLFVKLASSVYERCTKDGLDFVYGFPNVNSVHGFWTHLGWHSLDPVPELVRPLSLGCYLRRAPLLKSIHTQVRDSRRPPQEHEAENRSGILTLAGFGPETDQLWHEFGGRIKIAIERDHDFMNWRFSNNPDYEYSIKGHSSGNRLDALVVYSVTDSDDGRDGWVMELLHREDSVDAALLLLRGALTDMRLRGCDAAHCWCLKHSPNYNVFKKAGFMARPTALLGSQTHFGVKPLANPDSILLRTRENWYVSYVDCDTL